MRVLLVVLPVGHVASATTKQVVVIVVVQLLLDVGQLGRIQIEIDRVNILVARPFGWTVVIGVTR